MRENTFFFKGIRDAVKLRRQISECFERASIPHTPKEVPILTYNAIHRSWQELAYASASASASTRVENILMGLMLPRYFRTSCAETGLQVLCTALCGQDVQNVAEGNAC